MKILLITKGTVDYLTCQIVHGMYNILGADFTHSDDYSIMYKNTMSAEVKSNLYGRGFTMYGLLDQYLNDNSDIENKIKNRYFDKILIDLDSVNHGLTDLSLTLYNPKDIAYLDTEDIETLAPYYQDKFLGKIKYFKREKNDVDSRTYPIAYSIPSEKFKREYVKKKKIANVLPGEPTSYIYTDESEYYNDYGESYFGHTKKKGGWDCLRHYEILANYCMPIFEDLELCPENTMFIFPKKEVIESVELYEKFNEHFNEVEYYDKLNFLYEYTKKNLTTIESAKYVINKLNE